MSVFHWHKMNIPTAEQLNPFPDSLDGRMVVEHFLGKSVADAVGRLEENSARYQGDYLWMGPEAFCYYVPAIVRYLRSDAASDDCLFTYSMLTIFRHRIDNDGVSISSAFPIILEFCRVLEEESIRLGFDENYTKRAHRRIAEVKAKIAEMELDDEKTEPFFRL